MLRLFKRLWVLLPVVMIALLPQAAAAYGTFNLADEWSDGTNPNGLWSYNDGSVPMTYHVDTEWGQPAWSSNAHGVPLWFKCNSNNPLNFDIKTGDVGMHAGYYAPTDVTWTVDSTGFATISGGVWMIRDIYRGNGWALYRNADLLTQGQISSGDDYSRSNPFLFTAGSRGPGAVTLFAVTAGDTIKLSFSPGPGTPDYAGMNLQIVTSPVPVPPSAVLLGTGLLGLWAWRRRGRQI